MRKRHHFEELPGRDFHLNPEPRFVQLHTAYLARIETMLGFAGITDAKPRGVALVGGSHLLGRS